MNQRTFKKVRIGVVMFVAFVVSMAASMDNIYLALFGVLIGMLFMFLVKQKVSDVLYDERTTAVAGKAARMTYAIVTPILALLSLILMIVGRRIGDAGLETAGTILSYAMLLNVAVYALFFKLYTHEHGGDTE